VTCVAVTWETVSPITVRRDWVGRLASYTGGVDTEKNLSHSQLTAEQSTTLDAERLARGPGARLLFLVMDLVYGRAGSLEKFRVLEVVARVPYIAWEQVAYVAITHTHSSPRFARDIHAEVTAIRAQQDNESFHLLILEELLQKRGIRLGFWKHRAIPQVLAWSYYHLSWLLYVLRPRLSYLLNAQFEDHAEHEYMSFVAEHPELDAETWSSSFEADYGSFESVSDMLRRIALDERHHKLESLDRIKGARFGSTASAAEATRGQATPEPSTTS
jgi:ubiquinol oxidase